MFVNKLSDIQWYIVVGILGPGWREGSKQRSDMERYHFPVITANIPSGKSSRATPFCGAEAAECVSAWHHMITVVWVNDTYIDIAILHHSCAQVMKYTSSSGIGSSSKYDILPPSVYDLGEENSATTMGSFLDLTAIQLGRSYHRMLIRLSPGTSIERWWDLS